MVERDFTAAALNQLKVSDLMYIVPQRDFVYIDFVIDAFSHRTVG